MLLLALEPVAFIPSTQMRLQTTFSVCLIPQNNRLTEITETTTPESTGTSDSSISENSTTLLKAV